MLITVLQAKIHRATVTDACLDYEGSLTIDKYLMELAGLVEYQQIQVYNITNGNRFTTYAIEGPPESGTIQVNGAAAHLAQKDDLIIIATYGELSVEEAKTHKPALVYVNKQNRPVMERTVPAKAMAHA